MDEKQNKLPLQSLRNRCVQNGSSRVP